MTKLLGVHPAIKTMLFLLAWIGPLAAETPEEAKEKLSRSAFQNLPLIEVYDLQLETMEAKYEVDAAILEFQKQLDQLPHDPDGQNETTRERLESSITALKTIKSTKGEEKARIEIYIESRDKWFFRNTTESKGVKSSRFVLCPGTGLIYRNDPSSKRLYVSQRGVLDLSMALHFDPRFKILDVFSRKTTHAYLNKENGPASVFYQTSLKPDVKSVLTFDWESGAISKYQEIYQERTILSIERKDGKILFQSSSPMDGMPREKGVYQAVIPEDPLWYKNIDWDPVLPEDHDIQIYLGKHDETTSNELKGKRLSEISVPIEPESPPTIWKPFEKAPATP